MGYANGYVPASALAPLDGQPGCSLRADAAYRHRREGSPDLPDMPDDLI